VGTNTKGTRMTRICLTVDKPAYQQVSLTDEHRFFSALPAGMQVCRKIRIVLVIQRPAKQDYPVFIQFKKLIPGLVNSLNKYKII